jgi:hypothetical protein
LLSGSSLSINTPCTFGRDWKSACSGCSSSPSLDDNSLVEADPTDPLTEPSSSVTVAPGLYGAPVATKQEMTGPSSWTVAAKEVYRLIPGFVGIVATFLSLSSLTVFVNFPLPHVSTVLSAFVVQCGHHLPRMGSRLLFSISCAQCWGENSLWGSAAHIGVYGIRTSCDRP